MMTMVNSRPTMAVGLSLGMNLFSNQSRPFVRMTAKRVTIPATRGTPRKMRTLRATSHMETCTSSASPPLPGKQVPDEHHGDAAGQPGDDQPDPILGHVRQEDPGQKEHDYRPDEPVQH